MCRRIYVGKKGQDTRRCLEKLGKWYRCKFKNPAIKKVFDEEKAMWKSSYYVFLMKRMKIDYSQFCF